MIRTINKNNVQGGGNLPKNQTLFIQEAIYELGRKLGFISATEHISLPSSECYAPKYDVVWYFDTEKYFNIDALKPLFSNNPVMLDRIRKLPFAGFEIEGSTTSSKNQLSNFANLYCGDYLFNFVIVNNDAAVKENDTYRRGLKLHRYFTSMCGYRNTFFADWTHISRSIENLKTNKDDIFPSTSEIRTTKRSTYGGEVASVEMYEKIVPYISNSGMEIRQNYAPDKAQWEFMLNQHVYNNLESSSEIADFYLLQKTFVSPDFKQVRKSSKPVDSYYIPKLDVVSGFNSPRSFIKWMKALASELNNDVVNFPMLFAILNGTVQNLFLPIISIEIESSINKHMNGGILNMAKNSFCGILVTKSDAKPHLEFFKNKLNCNNIVLHEV